MSHLSSRPVPLALLAASLGGLFVWFYYTHRLPSAYSDFDQIWQGAWALLQGEDPYRKVADAGFPWPLYYPAPALFFGLPFTPFPAHVARILFGAVSAGLCAYAIFRWRAYAWPLLCTGPFVHALQRGQWSPLLVASVFVPALGAVLLAKPTIGAAVFAYHPSRAPVYGGLAIGALALLWVPDWPWRWLESRHGAHHLIVPVSLPGGWLLLAALLRWRRPEARLLGLLTMVPQTFSMYELVCLGLIPRNRREALALAVALNVLYVVTIQQYGAPLRPSNVSPGYMPASWIPTLVLAYLPALWLVLRPFPLWQRPAEFEAWPGWRRTGYAASWGLILMLMVLWAAGGGWLIWRHLVGPMLGYRVS